jgi:hypothetical protein
LSTSGSWTLVTREPLLRVAIIGPARPEATIAVIPL